jgi:hypothetical protein
VPISFAQWVGAICEAARAISRNMASARMLTGGQVMLPWPHRPNTCGTFSRIRLSMISFVDALHKWTYMSRQTRSIMNRSRASWFTPPIAWPTAPRSDLNLIRARFRQHADLSTSLAPTSIQFPSSPLPTVSRRASSIGTPSRGLPSLPSEFPF